MGAELSGGEPLSMDLCDRDHRPNPRSRSPFATRDEIADRLSVTRDLLDSVRREFPVQWPRDYLDLVGAQPAQDPIARMGRPDPVELMPSDDDLVDPIADRARRPVPFMVRKHRDRVILLTTKKCHFYCRFCFRREEPVGRQMEPTAEDWQHIYDYLAGHPEIEEPILSGGDPLTLSDRELFDMRDRFNQIPSLKRWRIHSRAPVHFPHRVQESLIAGLVSPLPLRFVTHFNHVREIGRETERIAAMFERHGIAFLNQAVLLAGVNDSVQAQKDLWEKLNKLNIHGYYLHHPDRVSGNAHFRLSIARGLEIFSALLERVPVGLPRYVIDLPDGSGKVPVSDLQRVNDGIYQYNHPSGHESFYRDIEAAR